MLRPKFVTVLGSDARPWARRGVAVEIHGGVGMHARPWARRGVAVEIHGDVGMHARPWARRGVRAGCSMRPNARPWARCRCCGPDS